MDNALFSGGTLLIFVLAATLFCARSTLLPPPVMPFAALEKKAGERILRDRSRFRGAALIFFILAVSSLFGALPRGVTLLAAAAGFFCQFMAFRLRRLYPVVLGDKQD